MTRWFYMKLIAENLQEEICKQINYGSKHFDRNCMEKQMLKAMMFNLITRCLCMKLKEKTCKNKFVSKLTAGASILTRIAWKSKFKLKAIMFNLITR